MSQLLSTPYRPLTHVAPDPWRSAALWLAMLGLSAYVWSQDVWLFYSWTSLFEGLSRWLGWSGQLAMSSAGGLVVNVTLPVEPANLLFSLGSALGSAAVLWALSYALPKVRVEAIYSVRALSLLLGLPALGYLALNAAPPFTLVEQVAGLFKMGYWAILFTPVLYALTLLVLPGNFMARVLGVVLVQVYQVLTIPVLALFHATVLTLLGMAWAPFMNILFGILMVSIHWIAFYGWMASFKD